MKNKYKVTISGESFEELKDNIAKINGAVNGETVKVNAKNIPVEKLYNDIAGKEFIQPGSPKDIGFAAALAADGHIAPPANNTFNPNPAQANPPVAPINNAEVDGANLRWDARIHSSNKQKTGKGVWQKKRGVSDELIAQVETELRNTGAIANTQPPAGQQFMTSAPVNPQPAFNPAQFQQPAAPVNQPAFSPAATFVAQQPAAPVNNGPVDFNAFLQRIGHLFSSGVVTQDYLTGLAQRVGQGFQVTVASIADISGRQDMVDYAVSIMKSEGKW